MKTVLTTLVFVLFIGTTYSQVQEMDKSLSFGNKPAFVQEHSLAKHKDIYKLWEKKFKEYGKVQRNKKAKEWSCLQCNIPSIGDNLNIYFKVEEGRDIITTYTYFDTGEEFITSDNDSSLSRKIEDFLTDLGYDAEKQVVTYELKDEEDNLKDRNKELSKLEKKYKNLLGDIEDYKRKIKEAEAEVEQNLQDQEEKKMEVEKQKVTVEKTTEKLNSVGKVK